MRAHGFGLLLSVHFPQLFGEARTNYDDISLLEIHTLFFGYGLYLFDCDSVGVERIEFDALSVGPGLVVDKDAATNQATTFVPVLIRYQLCTLGR